MIRDPRMPAPPPTMPPPAPAAAAATAAAVVDATDVDIFCPGTRSAWPSSSDCHHPWRPHGIAWPDGARPTGSGRTAPRGAEAPAWAEAPSRACRESRAMIVAQDLELRAGARLLSTARRFRIGPGDRVGLVGRNGAGKTTLTKVLAGEAAPAAGTVTRSGEVGYLPQDPRTGDLDVLARDRVLSARGLDEVRPPDAGHRGRDGQRRRRRTRRGDGGATAGSRPSSPPSAATPPRARRPDRGQPRPARPGAGPAAAAPCPAVSGAGSSWPASCSPAPRPCCSTSPPTTSTPTRSSGCATSCRTYERRAAS